MNRLDIERINDRAPYDVACIVQRDNPHLDEIIHMFDADITMFNEMKP